MYLYEKVILAASVATAVVSTSVFINRHSKPVPNTTEQANATTIEKAHSYNKQHWLAMRITQRYSKTDPNLAHQVATAATKYQHRDFPKAEDIVAVVAIESIFDPKAKSKLRNDPAKGLMQVRHGIWKHKIQGEDMTKVSNQIKHGADILAHYYDVLQDKNEAIMAYNVGLTAVLKGRENRRYLAKYYRELKAFTRA